MFFGFASVGVFSIMSVRMQFVVFHIDIMDTLADFCALVDSDGMDSHPFCCLA